MNTRTLSKSEAIISRATGSIYMVLELFSGVDWENTTMSVKTVRMIMFLDILIMCDDKKIPDLKWKLRVKI